MRKAIAALSLALLVVVWGDASAHALVNGYTARVVAGTIHYGPCVQLNHTREGRTWYRDMISDNTDDGHKRSVSAQIHYVRTGCVSLTEEN